MVASMTGPELRDALREMRLSPAIFTELVAADRTTVWRWLNGRTPVPAHIEAILDQQRRLIALARQLVDLGARPCVPPIR